MTQNIVSQILISSWFIGSFDECVTSESDTGNDEGDGQYNDAVAAARPTSLHPGP